VHIRNRVLEFHNILQNTIKQEGGKYILDKEQVETEWGKWLDEVIV